MNSTRKAQKTIKPEAISEWGRGGCVGPKNRQKLSYIPGKVDDGDGGVLSIWTRTGGEIEPAAVLVSKKTGAR